MAADLEVGDTAGLETGVYGYCGSSRKNAAGDALVTKMPVRGTPLVTFTQLPPDRFVVICKT